MWSPAFASADETLIIHTSDYDPKSVSSQTNYWVKGNGS